MELWKVVNLDNPVENKFMLLWNNDGMDKNNFCFGYNVGESYDYLMQKLYISSTPN